MGNVLLLAPTAAIAQSFGVGQVSILGQFGLENSAGTAIRLLGWAITGIWLNCAVLFAIARWRGQPRVGWGVVKDTATCTLWLVSIVGCWVGAFYLLRAAIRALTCEDVDAGALE